jgi:hypothetical protein
MKMKKILVLVLGTCVSLASWAQTYLEADAAVGRVSASCAANNDCKQHMGGYAFRFGAKLPSAYVLSYEGLSLDAFEVGLVKSARYEAQGRLTELYFTGSGTPRNRVVSTKNSLAGNGMYSAMVAHLSIMDDLSAFGKLGLTYVSATSSYWVNGVSSKAQTANHFAPFGAIGIEYDIGNSIKVATSLDVTRLEVGSVSARWSALTFGVRKDF